MQLSNLLVLAVSAATTTLATPVAPEAAPGVQATRDTVEFLNDPESAPGIERRQNLNVQVCGGANWQVCADVGVPAHNFVAIPWNTFGSFNTRGVHCKVCTSGRTTCSNEFSGSLGNVKASWGDFWFFNAKEIGCW